tara:strand:- start:1334 stop:2167 length:834 start_codon:yes stop_codon:yes gene_type:complete
MPYLGSAPTTSFQTLAKQDFSVSATANYTLSNSVTSANDIALFINNVRQEPTTAYSASGTALTLTEATAGSDDMYCVYLGKAVGTINPASGSVGLAQLSATGTKSSSTFLRGDNSFATPVSGDKFYSEMFIAVEQQAYNTAASQGSSAGSYVKLGINTVMRNDITSASLSSSVISLPAGTYYTEAFTPANKVEYCQARLRDTTNSTSLVLSSVQRFVTSYTVHGFLHLKGHFTLSDTANIEFQAVGSATDSNGFGRNCPTGVSEVSNHGNIMIIKVA